MQTAVVAVLLVTIVDAAIAAPGSVSAPPSGLSPQSAKRIGAVADTLTDLLASITSEETDETANFKSLMEWCEDTTTALEDEIDSTQASHENNQVAAKQHAAAVASLDHILQENANEVEDVKNAIAQANSIREQESAKYSEERSLNMQSSSQITQAIKIVGQVHQAGGFLQGGVVQRVQLNEPGESSYVLGVMKQLRNTLDANMQKAEKAEVEKQARHDELTSTKQAQLKSIQELSSKKRIAQTGERTGLAQVEADLKRDAKALREAEASLKHTQEHCSTKKEEWRVRTEERAKEKSAIQEAISFLMLTVQGGAAPAPAPAALSFLQLRVATGMSARARALLAVADGELATASAHRSEHSREDAFAKVKRVIQELIEVIQKEQKAEAAKEAHCVSVRERKLAEREDTKDAVETLNATIAHKTSLVETLSAETNQLNSSLVQSAERLAEAQQLRKDENSVYEAGSKDRRLAVKVLREATLVLKRFYDSQEGAASFAQVVSKKRVATGAPEPPSTWTSGSSTRHAGEGNIVLNMMDTIREDVEAEQKEAAATEAEAVREFAELQRDTRLEFDEGMREITLRMSRRAKTLVQLDSHRETQEAKMESLQAITDQLVSLAEECNMLVKNFPARTKARDFEIEQLRDAHGILSGSSIAARTGLIQGSAAGMTNDPTPESDVVAFNDMSSAVAGLESRARMLLQ